MTLPQEILYQELLEEAIQLNDFQFEFSIEMWGVMWMPFFFYFGDKTFTCSRDDITIEDVEALLKAGLITTTQAFDEKELDDLELSRVRYQIVVDSL